MISPLALGSLALSTALAGQAVRRLSVTRATDSALTEVFRDTLVELGKLRIERVERLRDHHRVQWLLLEGSVSCPAVAQAWAEHAETIVHVDAQPRATRPAAASFELQRLKRLHHEGLGLPWNPRWTANAPAALLRGGLLGTLLLVVALLAADVPLAGAAHGGFTALAWLLLPALVGGAASMLVRQVQLRAADGLERALDRLCFYLDTRYAAITAEQLLARLLVMVPIAARRPAA